MTSPRVVAVIPARGGSKRVPRKNLRIVGGKPLVAWSIEQALSASSIARTIVTTDDEEIATVARACGADVPFLRPAAIAGDASTDLEAFTHLLEWLREHEGTVPDVCVHLRPTYPLRRVSDIDAMVRLLVERPEIDAVRSIAVSDETPFKMWFRDEAGRLAPVVTSSLVDPWNMPRQQLPVTYIQNASIDVVWSRVILERRSMTGRAIHGYVMDANFDIDTEADLQRVSDRLEALNRHD